MTAPLLNEDIRQPTQENGFLFIPNLIGYTRIIFAVASLYYMPLHPRTCSLLYSTSCLLDALDGAAARHFKQSTRFGAVLDMITDRCTTTCLLVFLASAFPRWSIIYQGLISLDYSSHYIHMYATLAMGGSRQSHKDIDENRPWVMRLYYSNTYVLFTVCTLNELFFIALYLLSFSSPTLVPSLLMNQKPSAAQPTRPQIWNSLWSAGAMEMARANKIDSSVPWALLAISSVFMLFKQYVNIVQLVEASKWLVQGDMEMRKKERVGQKKIS
ncbi:phosphatidylinositol synthase [Aspergillus bertholletiae]|uniref:CDP-diacylglycerol--inositol 3-phosphatidyltransferase n=1 Tax=Aspergillus bertholletiae TaxID=1226010 RepID=A0A5N7BEQ1_9EURO|nr:phosphatidylinositol synthase [Aspergillus bertholletiae]